MLLPTTAILNILKVRSLVAMFSLACEDRQVQSNVKMSLPKVLANNQASKSGQVNETHTWKTLNVVCECLVSIHNALRRIWFSFQRATFRRLQYPMYGIHVVHPLFASLQAMLSSSGPPQCTSFTIMLRSVVRTHPNSRANVTTWADPVRIIACSFLVKTHQSCYSLQPML
jgi:hypothetical protein